MMGVRVGLVVGLCLAFVTTVYADVDVMGEIRSGDDATLYGDWDRAVKHSTNAIVEQPNNIFALLKRATAYKSTYNYNWAMQDVKKIIEIDPEDTMGRELVASIFFSTCEIEQTENMISIILKHDKESDQAAWLTSAISQWKALQIDLVSSSSGLKNAQHAFEICDKMLDLTPDCIPVMQEKVSASRKIGNSISPWQTVKLLGKMIRLSSSPEQTNRFLVQRGDAYFSLFEVDLAHDDYRHVLRSDEDTSKKAAETAIGKLKRISQLMGSARSLKDKGDVMGAMKNLNTVLSENSDVYFLKKSLLQISCEFLDNTLELEMIMGICGQAIEYDPLNLSLDFVIAKAQKANGDLAAAEKTCRQGWGRIQNNDQFGEFCNEVKYQLEWEKRKDYYGIMGIESDATEAEIKKIYKKLALKYHPDKNKDNPEEAKTMFADVAEAYKILMDSEARRLYDSGDLDYMNSI